MQFMQNTPACSYRPLPLHDRNNLCDFNISNYVTFTHGNNVATRNTSDITKLNVPHCKTTAFCKLYFNRIVHSWNSLPASTRLCNNLAAFKYNVHKYCTDVFNSKFDPDRVCTWYFICKCSSCSR